jgi:hypothetical protein
MSARAGTQAILRNGPACAGKAANLLMLVALCFRGW